MFGLRRSKTVASEILSEAREAFEALLRDESVKNPVKRILRSEYEPGTALFDLFVEHSHQVARDAVELAGKSGGDAAFVREAAWLHDVGIKYTRAPGIHCSGEQPYLRHGVIGREICEAHGLFAHGLVCERHVGTGFTAQEIEEEGLPLPVRDMLCRTLEERLICYVDQFYSKSSRGRLSLDAVTARIKRHGEASWRRFEEMHADFGRHYIG